MCTWYTATTQPTMLKTFGDRLLVEPYYEGEFKLGHIIIPDSVTDTQPSQGVVLVAPDKFVHLQNRYVIFHRFRERAWYEGNLVLEEQDLVCFLNDGEIELLPHREEVLVQPDWDSKYKQPSQWIELHPSALEHNQPVIFGTIVDCTDKAFHHPDYYYALHIGYKVAFEPGKGSEVGLSDGLRYIIPVEHILATING